jgi:hypothetical protein
MSETENTTPDFDLDFDSDEVSDLISYVNPPNGIHIYGLVFCGMDKAWAADDAPIGVRLIYQKITTIEKANKGDLDAPDSSLFTENFTGNDMGKQLLKARLKQIFGEAYTGGVFRPWLESLQEQKMSAFHLQLTTQINISRGKGDKKDKTYENVRIKALVPVACMELPPKWEQFEYEPKTD